MCACTIACYAKRALETRRVAVLVSRWRSLLDDDPVTDLERFPALRTRGTEQAVPFRDGAHNRPRHGRPLYLSALERAVKCLARESPPEVTSGGQLRKGLQFGDIDVPLVGLFGPRAERYRCSRRGDHEVTAPPRTIALLPTAACPCRSTKRETRRTVCLW